MAGSSKSRSFWYGYLAAGERGSPVLRDFNLETGNRKTIYLFNLKRGEIIEYVLEIVESKLRELNPDESGLVAELKAAYKKARRGFRARGNTERSVREATIVPLRKIAGDSDDEAGGDDSDVWLEYDEA